MASPPSHDSAIHFTREVTWVDSSSCQSCNKSYWIPWKHHCRACGGCFCQSCSSKTLALPPKHPEPVRVCNACYAQYSRRPAPQPTPAAKASTSTELSSRDVLSASLPVDFFTRGKIEEYSGARPDPLSASVALGADSPTAKWLTERHTSSYYATPPPSSTAEPDIEAIEDKVDEGGNESSSEPDLNPQPQDNQDVPVQPTATEELAHQADEEPGVDEKSARTQDQLSAQIDERGEENKADEQNAGQQVTSEEEGVEVKPHDDSIAIEQEDVVDTAIGKANDEKEGEEGEGGGEEVEKKNDVLNMEASTTDSDSSEGETEVAATHSVTIDANVNNIDKHEISTKEEVIPQDVQPDVRLAERGVEETESEVKELKEKIILTEEEDEAEAQKQEAIKHKLQTMNISSLREYLELSSLAAKELSSSILYGLRDSLRLGYASISIQKSNRVYNHIIDTFILNGPLLLCMYILFKYIFDPHFHSVLHWKEHRGFTLVFVEILEFLLKACFLVLWVGPIYVLSLVLNMQWSQEVGNGAFSLYLYIRRGKTIQKASKPLSDTIAQIIYWQIIFGVFNLINFLCKFVPFVGPPFYFLCLCWLNAVYCFDLKWGNQKWSLHKKISYCETRWLYFIGFGVPITLATFFFEYIICYSLLSLLFPLFIPMAMYGSPKTQSLWKPIPVSRILDSSIIAPLLRFIFTVPSQIERLERKVDTILRLLVIAVCSSIALGVAAYLGVYFLC